MLLLLLASCACPSFDEMAVDDPRGLTDADFDAEVTGAIADFAAWTGREGVCVPAVKVVEELSFHGERVAGQYAGPNEPIRLAAYASDPRVATVHELCHALDEVEGHVAARPDLFPPEDVPADAVYDTDTLRASEAFARACEDGPTDLALEAALAERCGGEGVDPVAGYLAAEVYGPAGSTVEVDPSLAVQAHAVPFGRDVELLGAAGVGGELLLLLRWTEGEAGVLAVSRVDRGTWELDTTLILGAPSDLDVLAAADEDVGVVISSGWDEDIAPMARRFDLDAGTVGEVDGEWPDRVISAAWSGDRLFVSGWVPVGDDEWDGRVRVWPDGAVFASPRVARALLPTEAGVAMLLDDGIARWDGEELETEVLPWISENGFGRWNDGRVVMAPYVGGDPVPLLYAAGTFTLPADPCVMTGAQAWMWADLDGAVFIFGAYAVPAGGTLPIFEVVSG